MCSWPCIITTIRKICITQCKTVHILQVEQSFELKTMEQESEAQEFHFQVAAETAAVSSCPYQSMTPPLRLGKLLVKLLLLFEVGSCWWLTFHGC